MLSRGWTQPGRGPDTKVGSPIPRHWVPNTDDTWSLKHQDALGTPNTQTLGPQYTVLYSPISAGKGPLPSSWPPGTPRPAGGPPVPIKMGQPGSEDPLSLVLCGWSSGRHGGPGLALWAWGLMLPCAKPVDSAAGPTGPRTLGALSRQWACSECMYLSTAVTTMPPTSLDVGGGLWPSLRCWTSPPPVAPAVHVLVWF